MGASFGCRTAGWPSDAFTFRFAAKGHLAICAGQRVRGFYSGKIGWHDLRAKQRHFGVIVASDISGLADHPAMGVTFGGPASTTDTVNPVAGQAELNGVPCLLTGAPWQAVIFPRSGGEKRFALTYHFFWGLDEALNTFVGLWNALETNRNLGMLCPQNADGETRGNNDYGLRVPTQKAGYKISVPGFLQPRQ